MEFVKPKVAILYDFDKTLSPKDMQEFGYIEKLGVNEDEFWEQSHVISTKYKADNILSYMYLMVKSYKEKGISLTKDYFYECGKNIKLYEGVETWFTRLDEYAKEAGVEIEHYVVSSGLKEMIEGTPIAKYFKEIYAGYFIYNDKNEPVWPALAINYTNKTQFVYRINRGILNVTDHRINEHMEKELRPVPFTNMIYIGDSGTDIPCMRLIMKSGGYTIAVYREHQNEEYVKNLISQNRINFIAKADYTENSDLENLIKEIVLSIKHFDKLKQINKSQKD